MRPAPGVRSRSATATMQRSLEALLRRPQAAKTSRRRTWRRWNARSRATRPRLRCVRPGWSRAGRRSGWRCCGISADCAPQLDMEVAGHRVAARVSLSELWRFYLPICHGLTDLAAGRTGPGAGRHHGARRGRQVRLQPAAPAGCTTPCRGAAGHAAVLPMDGFHYPNAYLDAHTIADRQGREVVLRSVKGSPPSYDVEGFIETLRRLRAGEAVAAPRYDRRLHDPVPDDIRIGARGPRRPGRGQLPAAGARAAGRRWPGCWT